MLAIEVGLTVGTTDALFDGMSVVEMDGMPVG